MALVDDIANFYPLRADVDDDASANNGTNTGVSFVADGAITVADFNGTSDRFTAPHQTNDPFSVENTTVSLWLKSTASGANAVTVGSHYTSGGATNPLYALYISASGIPWLLIRSNGGTLAQALALTAINDNLWHNVVFTRDPSNIRVFVDGILEVTTGFSGAGTLNNTNVMGAGCWVSVPNSNVATFYSGKMSDLATWRRVLSGAEITAIHTAGVGALASLIQLDVAGLWSSVVHSAPLSPVVASGLWSSVVHSAPLSPVVASGLWSSVVHDTATPPTPGGGDPPPFQGGTFQDAFFQGVQNFQPTTLGSK
jgi:hypothetical protein